MKPGIKLMLASGMFIVLIILTEIYRTRSTIQTEEFYDVEVEETYAISEDTTGILKTFFPEGEIIETNLIKWKPDLENRLQMNVSSDGFCYTSLDTIINSDNTQYKDYCIFTTNYYQSDKKKVTCQSCEPNISIGVLEGYANRVTAFYKNVDQVGEYGKTGEFELLSLGGYKEVLQLNTQIHSNEGGEHKFVSLIDTDKLKCVLKFESFTSNETMLNDPYGIYYGLAQKEVDLSLVAGNKGGYDIILNQKETVFDTISERLVTKFSSKVYRWNESDELELCYE